MLLLKLAYWSTANEVTDYPPNVVMTGLEVSLPLDAMMSSLGMKDKSGIPEYVSRL